MGNYLALDVGRIKQETTIQTSVGAADAGKPIALNAVGKIDPTLLPLQGSDRHAIVGVEAAQTMVASRFVNLFVDVGVLKVRLADNTLNRPAHGFIYDAVTAGNPVTVNTSPILRPTTGFGLSSETAKQFYLHTNGINRLTVPTGTGQIIQKIGTLLNISTKELLFQPKDYTVVV